jgi:hypothetical protein
LHGGHPHNLKDITPVHWFPLSRRQAFAIVLLLASTQIPALAAGDDSPRIRVVDKKVRAMLNEGRARSRAFNEVYEALDRQPVIVFVECSWFLPHAISGRGRLVASSGGYRYVHLEFNCTLPVRQRLSILAHELQHAREIGESTAITDHDSMAIVFEDIGFQTQRDGVHRAYETQAARDVQRRVNEELGD